MVLLPAWVSGLISAGERKRERRQEQQAAKQAYVKFGTDALLCLSIWQASMRG